MSSIETNSTKHNSSAFTDAIDVYSGQDFMFNPLNFKYFPEQIAKTYRLCPRVTCNTSFDVSQGYVKCL